MKKLILFLILIVVLISFGMFVRGRNNLPLPEVVETEQPLPQSVVEEVRAPEVIVSNLKIPWDIAFLPEGDLLVTERPGNLMRISADGSRQSIPIKRAIHKGEGGLLGLVLHPNFRGNRFLYLYMTVGQDALGTKNAVIRYRFADNQLSDEFVVIDDIPGAVYHDGGRLEFGPDGFLYITTGDATKPEIAQDLDSLGGKILRLKDDGSIPPGNPFGDAIYSFGHRNPQGLAWDNRGRLWETEHGRSGVKSGMDEINLIIPAENYGWPTIEGDAENKGMTIPSHHSGSDDTWAPASALYWEGSLFFGGLRGEALYEAVLDEDEVVEVREHFKGQYGRIRTVRLGPDNMFYITTSNTDDRGTARSDDDKIIKIDPKILR